MSMGWRCIACGLAAACRRKVIAMCPKSSSVVPYTCLWRCANMAIHIGGMTHPFSAANCMSPRIARAGRSPRP